MALCKKINHFSKQNNDTGFASNTKDLGGRFINKDGSNNLLKKGMPFRKWFSIFHDMLNLPLWKSITIILLFFYPATLFLLQFICLLAYNNWMDWWLEVTGKCSGKIFYFSTQTFITAGYVHVYPVGDAAEIVAALEELKVFFRLQLQLV